MEPISKMWLLLTPPQKFDTNYYNITTRAIFAKSFQNDLSSTHMELTVLDPIWFGFMQPLYIAKKKKRLLLWSDIKHHEKRRRSHYKG